MKPHVRRFLTALPFALAALAVLWWLLGSDLLGRPGIEEIEHPPGVPLERVPELRPTPDR